MSLSTDPLESLDDLADEFCRRMRQGENPSIDEFTERYPDLAEQIRALLPSIALLEEFSQREHGERCFVHQTIRLSDETKASLADYRILREVGRGGMGVVYEAEQKTLKRRVALKLLRPQIAGSQSELHRFRREAEAAARLHHTNIVPVFGMGEQDGLHFYAMQFIDGSPLSRVMDEWKKAQESPLPADAGGDSRNTYWALVARIGADAASALAYAHRHGILHRDIKPANLLLDHEGIVWITDFGLAKHEEHESVTRTGDIVGTLRYMAPEQFDGRNDARGDVYSLGLTLYEMLTFIPAFEESRHGALIQQKLQSAPRAPREINPEIPRDLETITLKACAAEPKARYQSAQELADDLHRYLEDRPILARRATMAERTWRWARRNPAIAGLGSVAAMLLVSLAVVLAIGSYRTRVALDHVDQERKKAIDAATRADRERARAETNLDTALQAFEQIIANIATRGIPQSVAAAHSDAPLQQGDVALTPADTQLLQSLLRFFAQLAEQNQSDLTAEFADAQRRVGDIQVRLGNLDEAERAYRMASQSLQTLIDTGSTDHKLLLSQAKILNQLGVVTSLRGDGRQARELHEWARALIQQSAPLADSDAGKYELARAFNYEGSVGLRTGSQAVSETLSAGSSGQTESSGSRSRSRPRSRRSGMGPHFSQFTSQSALDSYEDALDLLSDLTKRNPGNSEYRLAMAKCYRNRARVDDAMGGGDQTALDSLNKSVQLLDELVEDFPDVPHFRYQLADTLCMSVGSADHPIHDPDYRQRIERAVATCNQLMQTFPHYAEYQALSGSAFSKLAASDKRAGNYEAAALYYRRAMRLQGPLAEQYPSVALYQIAYAQSLLGMAEVADERQQHEAALGHLNTAIELLEHRVEQRGESWVFRRFLARLHEKRHSLQRGAESEQAEPVTAESISG